MSKMYTDYVNRTALTVPEQFIDVRTGENIVVSSKVQEQIDYHAHNGTLIHLILSALNSYFHTKRTGRDSEEVLIELAEIKRMLQQGAFTRMPRTHSLSNTTQQSQTGLDMREVEDILDVFGG